MFVLDDNLHGFKIRQVWFAERPQDLEGFSKVMFYFTKSSDRDAPAGFSVGETRLRVIDISRSADDIYKTFHRNTRYCITQAKKQNPEVRINSDYDGFCAMLNDFLKDKNLKLPTKVTKEQLTQTDHILATIYHEGKIVDGHYFAIDGKIATMIFSCSTRLHDKNIYKIIGDYSRYLIYMAMLRAKELGLAEFSLGAIGGRQGVGGVVAFKESFDGAERTIPFYTKTYSRRLKTLEFGRKAVSRVKR